MTKDYNLHYKEVAPEDTVEELIGILNANGVEVEEKWIEKSEINTHSMRLTLKGTNVGTNGKGVTREYARASAYGEFFERFQNELLWKEQWTSCFGNIEYDGIEYTAEEIVNSENPMMDYYFAQKKIKLKNSKVANIKNYEHMEQFVTGKANSYTCVPFYHLNKKEVVYMPQSIYMPIYGSNGMCAGNTREEALVQGLSEIVERVVQRKIFIEKLSCPNIPDEDIKKYPYIWEMYKSLKENKNLDVALKDCSLGGKYPVVALLVIQKNAGTYGVKLGCHPIISIAMERTLTEATQGQKIQSYSSMSTIDFYDRNVSENYNIENSMKVGIAQYPYEFLYGKPDYKYSKYKDLTGFNNKAILEMWLKEMMDDGKDILIRDVSHLGFPAYHIVIPSLSEMKVISNDFNKKMNTRVAASWLLRHRDEITRDNCKYIIGAIHNYAFDIQENDVVYYFNLKDISKFPGVECESQNALLCSLCYATEKDYKTADIYINKVIRQALNKKSNNTSLYLAIHYYYTLRDVGYSHKESMVVINKMFSTELKSVIDRVFKNDNLIIFEFYKDIDNCEKDNELDKYIEIYQIAKSKRKIDQYKLSDLLAS
ncbi:MAG: YcaO-like family protein [Butyrivibrio sp.]|nr:YcaO-like family protein [Butyrivibrio sp.]